jgi:hypothetical protein
MTVAELIQKLQAMPQDLQATVEGERGTYPIEDVDEQCGEVVIS